MTASLILGSFAIIFPLSLVSSFSSTLEQAERQRLAANARTVMAAVKVENGRLVMPGAMENPNFDQLESDLIALVFDDDGEMLWRSSSATDFLPGYLPSYNPDEAVFIRFESGEPSRDYFIYDLDVVVAGERYSIVTGDLAATFDSQLKTYKRQLRLWLFGGLGGLLLVLALGLAWSLRPLQRIYRQLKAVQRGRIDQLDNDYPVELDRLASGLNSLLAAERGRQQRYKTTMADLVHGLKTPLAVINETAQELPWRQRDVLESQVQRMNQLVNFHLQRAMPVRPVWVSSTLELKPVLEKLCYSLDKVYHDKTVYWHIEAETMQAVITEAETLEIFGNLLENAFRLCAGEVCIRAESGDGKIAIVVEDDGPGVPDYLRRHPPARGLRADTRNPGQGIGLALVVEMLADRGGRLQISDSSLGGACFTVFLPADEGDPRRRFFGRAT